RESNAADEVVAAALGPDPSERDLARVGRMLAEAGRPTEARPLLDRARVSGPASHEALEDVAGGLYAAGEPREALAALERFIADHGDVAWPHLRLAQIARELEEDAKTRSGFERYIELTGDGWGAGSYWLWLIAHDEAGDAFDRLAAPLERF